jgi:hypothetical protein
MIERGILFAGHHIWENHEDVDGVVDVYSKGRWQMMELLSDESNE